MNRRTPRSCSVALVALITALVSVAKTPASAATLVDPIWSRPYVTATLTYSVWNGLGAAIEGFPHPRWMLGFDVVGNRFGVNMTARLHFVPNLRRGVKRHQFLLGLGGDFGITPSLRAGGSATFLAPTIDLRYLGRPHASFGFILGTRLGIGVAWEARDLTNARLPSTALDHLALVTVLYVGVAIGRHTMLP